MPAEIRVSFDDVVEGRAYIRLPFISKLLLCHWAGAPWFDRDPKAFLHGLQVEVLAHREREQIVHGASRLGKSVLGGCRAICEIILPRRSLAVGASRYDHVAHEWQYLYRGMRRLFRGYYQAFKRLIFKHQQAYHDYDCDTIWGSRARGISTDSDEGAQFLGSEYTTVILGEGSHIATDILEKKIMRATDGALMKRTDGTQSESGFLYIFTTPKGHEGCSASEWDRVMKQTRRQPEQLHYGNAPFAQTVWLREANILENPAYDRDVFDARRKSISRAAFEEQYLGKMTFASGRVFAEWKEERHTRPFPPADYIRECRLGVGIDTGAKFGAVLAAVGKDNAKWILGNVYTEQMMIDDNCIAVHDMVVETLGPIFGVDNFELLKERVDLWMVDPSSQHKLEIIDRLDVVLGTPMASTVSTDRRGTLELLPSIDVLRAWFAADELWIADGCDDYIDQLRKYVWKQTKAVGTKSAPVIREPKKDYDHLIDAGRFILLPLADAGPLEEPPPPLTLADAWNNRRKEQLHGPLREILKRAEEKGGMWC